MEQGTEQGAGGNGRRDLEVIPFNNPMSLLASNVSFFHPANVYGLPPYLPDTMLGSRDSNNYTELDPAIRAKSKQIIMEI